MSYDYHRGAIVNPDAPKGSLEAKRPFVDNGTDVVDPSRYYSREFMAQEWAHLWPRVWLIAGPRSDLDEPGDFFVFNVGAESFIITLDDAGTVQAHYNVCPHRGNRVVLNERGSQPKFTCSFHSWRFNLDGSLDGITDEESFRPEVLCPRPRLTTVRCEAYAGLIWINMDGNAPPLKEYIGLPPEYLEAYELDKMHVVRHVSSEWAANWKTGVDAFYETYHLHAVHPQTATVMDDLGTQYDLYPNGASRMIVPFFRKSPRVSDQETVDEGLQMMIRDAGADPSSFDGTARDVRPFIQKHKRQSLAEAGFDVDRLTDGQLIDSWATGIFPNVQIGLHPEGAFLMRFLPHPDDPERFFYDTITLFRPSEDPNYRVPDWMGLPKDADLTGEDRPDTEHVPLGEAPQLGLVLDQDSELLPVVQKGVRSRGFRGPLWGEQESRVRHFHRELDRYLAGEK